MLAISLSTTSLQPSPKSNVVRCSLVKLVGFIDGNLHTFSARTLVHSRRLGILFKVTISFYYCLIFLSSLLLPLETSGNLYRG